MSIRFACRALIIALVQLCLFFFPDASQGGEHGCDRKDGQRIKAIGGRVNIGSEHLLYESRVERTQPDVWKFIYCIENKRLYLPVNVSWSKDDKLIYFRGIVPPGEELPAWSETLQLNYAAESRVLKYDNTLHSPPPETIIKLVQGNEFNQGELKLRSGAIFQIPASEDVEARMAGGKYDKYLPDDFLTLSLEFVSSLRRDGGKSAIDNRLYLRPLGDPKNAEASLEKWPRYLKVVNSEVSQFLLDKHDPNFGMRVSLSGARDRESFSRVSIQGPSVFSEQNALLVVVSKEGAYAVGALPVNYFAPF